jgi:rhodanese-related sulfurtransferase
MPSHIDFSSCQANPDHPNVEDIDPKELWDKRSQTCIVDVRRPDEFTGELGHIPGSRLIVLDALAESLPTLPQDRTVVFVCRSGARSGRAAAYAKASGFEHVYNMKGGMMLWNQMDLPVEGRNEG